MINFIISLYIIVFVRKKYKRYFKSSKTIKLAEMTHLSAILFLFVTQKAILEKLCHSI